MNTSLRKQVTVITATCLVCTNTVAIAQNVRPAKLAVIDVRGNSDPDSTDILYFVEKGVRTSNAPVSLVSTDQVLNSGRQQSQEQNLAFGAESLQAAKAHYSAKQYAKAAEHALQATVYFEQSHAFLSDRSVYSEAVILQGLSLARSGSRKNAVRVLSRAFVVSPKLDVSEYPKDIELLTEARSEAASRDVGSVTVVTIPESSRVFIDGRYRGVSPTYRPGLRRGVHFVRVERQGFARAGVRIDSEAGQDVKVEVVLKPAAKQKTLATLLHGIRDEIGREDLPATGATLRLKSLLLVDYVVLMDASGPSKNRQITLTLYNLNTGRRIDVVKGKVNWEQRGRDSKNVIMSLAQTLLASVSRAPVAFDVQDNRPGLDDGGIVTKWWFWTVIGVAAAGIAVGLAVGLQPNEPPPGVAKNGTGGLLLEF